MWTLYTRHSSVHLSVPTILLPWVRVPSTSLKLFSFIVIVLYLLCEKNGDKQKEAGFGPFKKRKLWQKITPPLINLKYEFFQGDILCKSPSLLNIWIPTTLKTKSLFCSNVTYQDINCWNVFRGINCRSIDKLFIQLSIVDVLKTLRNNYILIEGKMTFVTVSTAHST